MLFLLCTQSDISVPNDFEKRINKISVEIMDPFNDRRL